MKLQQLSSVHVAGLVTRTTNANESIPESAKIGELWGNFYQSIAPKLSASSTMYGVYTNYESDVNSAYDIIAGATALDKHAADDLVEIEIKAGKYLTFSAQGEMPQVVINLWGEIWQYFHDGACEHERAYTTDFECYKSDNEIEISIAIK